MQTKTRFKQAKGLTVRLLAAIGAVSLTVGVITQTALIGYAIEPEGLTPSSSQIVSSGGEATSQDGKVKVSKTISGTELENVFDITLGVQASASVREYNEKANLAVMIVLDVSNTMADPFGGTSRANAAIASANNFVDRFAAETSEVSRIGVVMFNSHSYYPSELQLQQCSSTAQAQALKTAISSNVTSIVYADKYGSSYDRFTNIESGIKRAKDSLNQQNNPNKFIIFLSDGFPTTYIQSGSDYNGWNTYCTLGTPGDDGVFYDYVNQEYCTIGASYSDKAAIRARQAAEQAKADGITVFSIGIDIGGQTIKKYSNIRGQDESGEEVQFFVLDRTGETYEIGGADSADDYKNWLKTKIGSGYYYDSTDPDGLEAAYNSIFAEIKRIWSETTQTVWITNDPMPEQVEFIGFFDKNGSLKSNLAGLSGENAVAAENTAEFDNTESKINWDLKQSGYAVATSGTQTTYSYSLKYRVRLRNELHPFDENTPYNTNNKATLSYQIAESLDGAVTLSEVRSIDFPVPSVKGYLVELSFTKLGGANGNELAPLSGAEFTLTHNTNLCPICHGDSTPTSLATMTATSAENGTVSFTSVPSGHIYTLDETGVPTGFLPSDSNFTVTAAYDKITVTETDADDTEKVWNSDDYKIVNLTGYQLPSTGGAGTISFMSTGITVMLSSLFIGLRLRRK